MDEKLEKALRALTGTSAGPFRAIAYGVGVGVGDAGNEDPSGPVRELKTLLGKEDLDPESLILVEGGDSRRPAVERPLFKTQILGRLEAAPPKGAHPKEPPAPLEGRGARVRARERLSQLSAAHPHVMENVDRALSGLPPPADAEPPEGDPLEGTPTPLALPMDAVPPPARPAADSRDLVWLLLVRRFEDLGGSAEAVSRALGILVGKGAHLVVHEDGLDTRTREGRALARMALRLGDLRAVHARERAIEDLERKRRGLQVYGPVPFGFAREGEELKPIDPQLAAVKRIRELSRLAQTPVTIAVTLNREKHRWKDGSLWSWRRVAQIRKNPLYDRVFPESRP